MDGKKRYSYDEALTFLLARGLSEAQAKCALAYLQHQAHKDDEKLRRAFDHAYKSVEWH